MPHSPSPLIACILCGLHILIIVTHTSVSVGVWVSDGILSSTLHVPPEQGAGSLSSSNFTFLAAFHTGFQNGIQICIPASNLLSFYLFSDDTSNCNEVMPQCNFDRYFSDS